MNAIENFYKTATNEDWETMAALRKETGKDPAKLADFKKNYGFTPDSIRPYELMHWKTAARICRPLSSSHRKMQSCKSKTKL